MKIRDLSVMAVEIPITQPVKMANATIRKADILLIRIDTDEGLYGLGECAVAPYFTGETKGGIRYALENLARPILIGQDPFRVEYLASRLDAVLLGNHSVKGAVDIALYDLMGKALGVPLYQLIGGKNRERVRATWHVAHWDPALDRAEAEAGMSRGFSVFKLKVGNPDFRTDVACTKAVREVLGDRDLRPDANQGWNSAEAVRRIREMEAYGITFFEQPVKWWDMAGMAKVAAAVDVPIVADEGIFTAQDAYRYLQAGATEIINMKLLKAGGITGALKLAHVAEAANIPLHISGKIAESSISTAAAVHLAVALKEIAYDLSTTSHYLTDDVVTEPLLPRDGWMVPPEKPGLGLVLDEKKVQHYTVK